MHNKFKLPDYDTDLKDIFNPISKKTNHNVNHHFLQQRKHSCLSEVSMQLPTAHLVQEMLKILPFRAENLSSAHTDKKLVFKF